MKIQVKEVNYFGYKQGVKVLIDGVKYPKKRGFFYCEFKDKEERVHWFQGIINNEKEYFNIPLHTPMSQL